TKRKADGKYPVYGANGIKNRTNEYYYNKFSIIVGRKGSAGEINLSEKRFWPLDVTYFVIFDEKKYDLFFIYYLLIKLELFKLAKGVKPGINRNEVYSLDVHVPSLNEQKQIVKKLKESFWAINKIKENSEKKMMRLEELKKSILYKAFKGEF
ncbi:MAG TPA: restriction endonuclease subunit S, partial [Ignavibacteria bacterium]